MLKNLFQQVAVGSYVEEFVLVGLDAADGLAFLGMAVSQKKETAAPSWPAWGNRRLQPL